MSKELLSIGVNAAVALSSVWALRDALSLTQEQKDAFNQKFRIYVEKQLAGLARNFHIEQPEEFSHNVLQEHIRQN
jgi:hypothetical protein